jgi:internalin A
MSSDQQSNVDYPYAPQPATVLPAPKRETPRAPAVSWRSIRRWIVRLACAVALVSVMLAMPLGIVAYRAWHQASVIERLDRLGCRVDYLGRHLYPGVRGKLQNYLRDKFGDRYFGEVFLVSAIGLEPSADARTICDLCRRFDRLEGFAIASDTFRFEQIADLQQLDRLDSLAIHSRQLTDTDLVRIGKMPKLRELELTSPNVTGVGLQHLSRAAELSTLVISATLDGSGPANDTGFQQLERLTILDVPQLHDEAIVDLGPLPRLSSITLDRTPVGDAAIGHLASSHNLAQVSLMQTHITDRALDSLANCSDLAWLDVSGTNVSDAGIAQLARCQSLTFLDVSETRATGKGLAGLTGSELMIQMNKCPVSDEGLRDLLQIRALEVLSISDTAVTCAGLKDLLATAPLRNLELAGAPLNAEGIAALAGSKIESLGLARTPIADQGLMLFVNNDVISAIDVSETKVTAPGVKAFYEARARRRNIACAESQKTLILTSDFPEAMEPFLPWIFGTTGISDSANFPLLPPRAEP